VPAPLGTYSMRCQPLPSTVISRLVLVLLAGVVVVGGCGGHHERAEPTTSATSVIAKVGHVSLVRGSLHGAPPTRRAVRLLIEGEWLRQELVTEGIAAPDAGTTERPRRRLIRMLLRKRAANHPDIGAREIRRYYIEHTELFKEPEQREIRLIRVHRRKQADAAVADSDVFLSLVARHSVREEAPGAGHDGAFTVVQGELAPALDEAVFAGGFGAIGGPLEAPTGWYVFEVHSATFDAVRKPLREVGAAVKRRIEAERRRPTLGDFESSLRRTHQPYTKCAIAFSPQVCAGRLRPQ
jgi:hypothetical protein